MITVWQAWSGVVWTGPEWTFLGVFQCLGMVPDCRPRTGQVPAGPLETPVVRQVAAILERRMAERGNFPENGRPWVFPSETATSGYVRMSV